MNALISPSDLDTTINHEPRIQDLKLGFALGMQNPHAIRRIIERKVVEFASYGEVSSTMDEITSKGGRPGKTYYLNEPQAMLLCMFSRTEKAAEVRRAIIEVFMAYRRGQLMPSADGFIGPEQQRVLQQEIHGRARGDRSAYGYFWNRFKNHYRIAKYSQLPVARFMDAVEYIAAMPERETKALPAPEAPQIVLEGVGEALIDVERRLDAMGELSGSTHGGRWLLQQIRTEALKNVREVLANESLARLLPGEVQIGALIAGMHN